jgi:hypothetical protein
VACLASCFSPDTSAAISLYLFASEINLKFSASSFAIAAVKLAFIQAKEGTLAVGLA